ncbi:MAG TPA: HlyD family efflux transporter periplasmic adaptor subunit [Pyrinomonadaceae bacterium]
MSGRTEIIAGGNVGRVEPRTPDDVGARKDREASQVGDGPGEGSANAARPGGARHRLKRVAPVVLVALTAGLLVWYLFLRRPDVPENVVAVSGRVEGDDAAVAAKTSGRIREITVREGDEVRAGQVIATLDDEQVRAREGQAESAVAQADARVLRAEQQIAVLEEQLEEGRLAVEQARIDAAGRVRQAEAQVAAAQAQLAQAEATYGQARYDAEKFTRLVRTGDVPERSGRQAQAAADAQAAVVAAARRQVEAARGALTGARASSVNPGIRSSQAAAIRKQIAQAQTDIDAARAERGRALAQLEEARANRRDLEIVAPFGGTIATRAAEPGEVVSAGTPVATVVNLGEVYLRAFVPEGDIGRVRVGQPARIFLDSNPGRPVEAYVARIDPQGSFTPENTYFRDDRVRQVFGVRLQLKSGAGFAKPGMPADGEILVQGEHWPSARRAS